MRRPRIKPADRDAWHHCYNRAVGTSLDRPFGPEEREAYIQFAIRLAQLYAVEIVAFAVLGNHFHLLLYVPAQPLSEEELCRRYAQFHQGTRTLQPGTPACRTWQARCRDLSWFMRHLQHLFSVWFNRTRGRRGPVWCGRFKNTVLDQADAVWRGWMYIEGNPVRAGLSREPGGYGFSSLGRWKQGMATPCGTRGLRKLVEVIGPEVGVKDVGELYEMAERILLEQVVGEVAGRYWVNGRVIGRVEFVKEVLVAAGIQVRGPPVEVAGGIFAGCACRAGAA